MVFVSSDKSMAEWQKYFSTMPWLSIPQGDKRKEQVALRRRRTQDATRRTAAPRS